MVKIMLILFCTFLCEYAFCQCEEDSVRSFGLTRIYDGTPIFSQTKNINDFIQENIIYSNLKNDSVEGKVWIELIILKDGTTIEHNIIKGLREDLDNEALRVAKLLKFEEPATLRGRPINIEYSIPIEFKRKNNSIPNLNDDERYLITIVESMPEFNGDLKEFINQNTVFPESAIQDSIEGTVYILFWVDIDGKTTDHEVIRGIRDDLDEEALRVARLILFEKAAMQRGKPVKVSFTIPVKFYFESEEKKIKSKRKRKST